MSSWHVYLFGKFEVQIGERVLADLHRQKVQELLGYLLLYRGRPHPRESLATMLWGENPTHVSRKYLRQALWLLRTALDGGDHAPLGCRLLLAEPEWIQINPEAEIWLDVGEVEQAFALVKGVTGHDMDAATARTVQAAVGLIRGELLEGCYRDWCLYERERLHNMHVTLLDKLVGYCEAHGEPEQGIVYATEVLRLEPARERTHRQLMRLYCLSKDRTAALRQYSRCVTALAENLGVRPAKRTAALYEQIQADRLDSQAPSAPGPSVDGSGGDPTIPQVLARLQHLNALLADVEAQIRKEIGPIEQEATPRLTSP